MPVSGARTRCAPQHPRPQPRIGAGLPAAEPKAPALPTVPRKESGAARGCSALNATFISEPNKPHACTDGRDPRRQPRARGREGRDQRAQGADAPQQVPALPLVLAHPPCHCPL